MDLLFYSGVNKIILQVAPKRKSDLLVLFAMTINNCYYLDDYYEKMHMKKQGVNHIQKAIEARYRIIENVVSSATYCILFTIIYPQYSLGIFILLLFSFCAKYLLEKKQVDYYLNNIDEDREAEYFRNVLVNPETYPDIKMYNQGNAFAEKSIRAFNSGLKKRYKLRRVNEIAFPLVRVVLLSSLSVALYCVSDNGNAELGNAVVAMTCIAGIIGAINPLCKAVFDYKEAKDIIDVSSVDKSEYGQYEKGQNNIEKIEKIRFENVSFAYSEGKQVIDNLSFEWKIKDSVSIIGENGSGKTTLVKLLLGINKPTSGRIYVNDIPLDNINIFSYWNCFGCCFQNYVLFEDTIRNNLVFSSEDSGIIVKDKELNKRILEFSNTFRDGLETKIGEHVYSDGVALSGGEQQKTALFRTLLKESEILVLDEPTASFDPQSEIDYFEFLYRLSSERALLLITHRIGFASLAKRILVMENGKIVEEGTHDILMSKHGLYYKMYASQAEMFREKRK